MQLYTEQNNFLNGKKKDLFSLIELHKKQQQSNFQWQGTLKTLHTIYLKKRESHVQFHYKALIWGN